MLNEVPYRGAQMPPTDPLIYRFYEMVMVNGPAWKALIEEEFGDGIMSAIDFDMEIERLAQPEGRPRQDHDVRQVPALQVLRQRAGHPGVRVEGGADMPAAAAAVHARDRYREGAQGRVRLEYARVRSRSRAPTRRTALGAIAQNCSRAARRSWNFFRANGGQGNGLQAGEGISGPSPRTGSRFASNTSSREAGAMVPLPWERAVGVRRGRY